uniref:Uncharacterized protein n=1 Tax=Arundo donax TaxID=35708 RepID=A0A0A9DC49_ARUDO
MLTRLLALAAHALGEAETRPEPSDLWKEPTNATMWSPCSDQRDWEASEGTNGYIMISANGGINQQRVAVSSSLVLSRCVASSIYIKLYSPKLLAKILFIFAYKDDLYALVAFR